jgi:hypothetical protein
VRSVLVAALLAAVVLAAPAVAHAGAIDLRIAYRATATAPVKKLTLRCAPARGTVASPDIACRKLIAIGAKAFAPTPRGMRACAQIYGGPQTALVTGTYFGRPVWTKLSRVDGCADARWRAVAFLFPSAHA